MSGFNPVEHIKGPAIVTFKSHSYYTEGDITVRSLIETWQPQTSMYGKVDERLVSRAYEISFTPVGACVAAYLTKAFPYSISDIGKSIFGSDSALVIWTLAGVKHTYARAAMTKMPGIRLGVGKGCFGPMSFRALLKTSTEFITAGAFNALSNVVFADTTFDETKLRSPGYTAAFGTTPFDAMESVDGFEIEIGMETSETKVDRFGLVDMHLKSLYATARFTPAGMTEANYLTLIGDGAATVKPGQSLSNAGTSLVIAGPSGGLSVTLANAGVKDHGWGFGDGNRLGEVTFGTRVVFTTGVPANPWTLAVVA